VDGVAACACAERLGQGVMHLCSACAWQAHACSSHRSPCRWPISSGDGHHVRVAVSAGDWAAVGQLLSSQGMGGYYDIILTAETIYNEDSQQRLLDCIKQVGNIGVALQCMPP
jgi:hypothetical protein